MRLDPRSALDNLEPFGGRVHMVKAVVGRRHDLNGFGADQRARRKISCPPAVGFDQTKDDTVTY